MVKTTQVKGELSPATQALLALASLVLAGALALTVWYSMIFAQHSASALARPYPLDGLEGTLLHEAWLLRSGEPLYQQLQPDRFVSSPYPPLHYALLAALAPQGVGPHVFFAGRLISLAAMLAAAAAIGALVLRVGRSLPAAALAVGLWLAFPPVQLWATRIKPDPLALALTALGLLAALHWREALARSGRHSRWMLAAASIFALASFTKQTAVAAPLAVCLACAADAAIATQGGGIRRFLLALRPGLLFGLLYAGLVAGGWLALELVTSGQYTFHVWGLHRSEWWSPQLLAKYVALLGPSWPLALAALALLPNNAGTGRLVLCYALVAPLTLLGAGETGANHNHLLETQMALTVAGCAAGGHAINSALHGSWRHRLIAPLLATILLAQAWNLRDRPAWYGGEFDLSATPDRYVAFIWSQPGEVLADDVGLLVAAGRPLRYDDPSTMGPAVSSGVWDESGLLAEVAAQHFSAILLPFDARRTHTDVTGRWSPEFIATLNQHYQVLYRDTIVSYIPKPRP
jgi:hypothetical protein